MQNFSCLVNGTVVFNKSCVPNRPVLTYSETYTLTSTVLLSILIPVIVFGNAFVILAFATTRRIRTTTNYFVVSLAITDILVGALSLPIFTLAINKGQRWQMEHPNVNQLWTATDMITAIASVVNLVYISVDRYICIQYPFRYHSLLNKTRITVMICVSWLYGILNYSLVISTYRAKRPRPDVVLPITIMVFVVPLLVILVMYARVGKIALSHRIRINAWKEQADTVKKNKGTLSLLRELKATRTLAVVVGAFVVCWLGYFVVLLRTTVCWWKPSLNCQPAPHEVVISVLWIKYFNSSLNPFIYAIMNGDMRKALKRFLRGKLIPSETSFEMR